MKYDINKVLRGTIIESEWKHAETETAERYNLIRALYAEAKNKYFEAEICRLESENHALSIGVGTLEYFKVQEIFKYRLDCPAWVGVQRYRDLRDNTISKSVFDLLKEEVVQVQGSEQSNSV